MSNVYSAYQHQSSGFQPERVKNYRLRIVCRPNLLLYAVLSDKDQILALKEYRAKSPMDFADFFDAVVGQDYFLKEEYKQVEFLNSNLEFSIIPTVFFKPAQVGELAVALIKENADVDHLAYADMESAGTTAIYTVSHPIKQKFEAAYGAVVHRPFCLSMVNMGMAMVAQHPQLVLLHVFERQFVITAFKEAKLQLCNAYDFETVTDMVYFLQLVMEILKLEPATTPILVGGDFEEDSELIRQLKRFVPAADIPKDAYAARFEAKGDKLPIWKYAFMSW